MNERRLLRLPSTQALACFEAAERLGSLTRAAAELHLTQGAVSRQIQALESRVGTRLVTRGRHALALTPAGRTYLADVRPLLQRLERSTADLASHGGLGGRLRLSVASTFASHWLIPRLPSFTAEHPDITLDLATRIGPVDFERVDADAAITFIDAPQPPATGVHLVPLRLRPYASRPVARSLPRGAGAPWLERAALLVNTSTPDGWSSWAAAAGVDGARRAQLRAGPRYDLLSMALNAALAGIGIALLPPFLAAPSVANRRLVALSALAWQPAKGYHLTYPVHHAELPALLRFRVWVLAQASAGADAPLSSAARAQAVAG
ncbi:LysR substrate-binding domain-containing protein [Rubrivivax sp. RP6-9]|uniref:LysR substrate-binding domain-containing protein n=1 Tax=Rubrivivax sp. RP6-9 TaxID=3415750 RepID=UPI003CC5987B